MSVPAQTAERTPIIALVVAIGENGAIGKDGNLPWRLSSDLKFFRKVTLGKPVIMGRRTYESLGRLLDQRVNIILTRQTDYTVPGAIVAHSLGKALAAGAGAAEQGKAGEVAVIGGADVFREVLPFARRIYLTEVKARPEADTWFPEFDKAEWREVSREPHQPGPKDDYPFSFVLLERI